MIFQDNHVTPMQVPDPRAAGIVTTTTSTLAAISRSTVFDISSDIQAATDTRHPQHTDISKQTNNTDTEDRSSTYITQNVKATDSRNIPQQSYTGDPVVCFLNDDVVTANPDMNSFRKFRTRRRILILTVMTIGFFMTMVCSLLFSCCTVITVEGSALPTRWESRVGAVLSDSPHSSSMSDISIPESDQSFSTLRSRPDEERRSMSQNLGIGSSEMLVVSGHFAGQASVLDREFYRKKIGSRTILLAPSSDTFALTEASLSHSPESPRSITYDISSQRSQAQIYQPKEAAIRFLEHVQNRHHNALQMQEEQSKSVQMTLQEQMHTEQGKSEKEQNSHRLEKLRSRHDQKSTLFHFWQWQINNVKLPQNDWSSNSLQDRQYEKRSRTKHRTSHGTIKNSVFPVYSEEVYFEEDTPIPLFSSSSRNNPSEQIDFQTEKNERSDKNNFIDFKKILSKSRSEEITLKSEFLQQVISQSERTSTKTPVSFKQKEESIKQGKHLIFHSEADISSRVTGTRDIGAINDIGDSHQINIDTVDDNVSIDNFNLAREVNDENSVIYTNDQKDYYYFPGASKTTGMSETKVRVPGLESVTKGHFVATEESPKSEDNFVDSKVKNNDRYFEYKDDEDGDDIDYYEDADRVVKQDTDISIENDDLNKPRYDIAQTRTSLAYSKLLSPSASSSFTRRSSFSSQANPLGVAFRKERQGASLSSLSPVVAVGPTSSSSARQGVKTVAKLHSILQQYHQSKRDLQTSVQNQSASLSSSSSSVSIASVLAPAPVTADVSLDGALFGRAGHSPYVLNGRNGPSGVRVQHIATKKLPQAIIIGVKKGGTRAVLEFLRLHPNVRAPGPEPHFFDRHYQKGFDWYRNKMPATFDDQITIEKTPSYFVTKEVPRRIFNMSKDIKLIVVVRDPVTRAISDYTQTVSKRPQVRSFEQMVFINNTRIVDTSWGAIRIGVYAKHVSVWLKFFNLSQIHFVNGERLITDPAGEMAQLQDFLGLKRIINERHFYFNETKGFPCLKKPEGSGHPHCLGKTKGRTHPLISQKVLKRLRDFYRPFNSKFYHLVHKDFQWS